MTSSIWYFAVSIGDDEHAHKMSSAYFSRKLCYDDLCKYLEYNKNQIEFGDIEVRNRSIEQVTYHGPVSVELVELLETRAPPDYSWKRHMTYALVRLPIVETPIESLASVLDD